MLTTNSKPRIIVKPLQRDFMQVTFLPAWTLGRSVNGFTLAPGQEWHRSDFTKDMLPDGWRPLLLNEPDEGDDEQLCKGRWEKIRIGKPTLRVHFHNRTRRPLPDPYAELKAAHKAGKVIQLGHDDNGWGDCDFGKPYHSLFPPDRYRIKPDPAPDADGWIPWSGGKCPVAQGTLGQIRLLDGFESKYNDDISMLRWTRTNSVSDIIAYRLTKPPHFIPWTRKTIAPLLPVVVKHKHAGNYYTVCTATNDYVRLAAANNKCDYQSLFANYTQRDGSPCGTEVK